MTRSLLLIAGFAFVACLVSFAVVLALGPVNFGDWDWDGDHGRRGRETIQATGPTITRELPWSGDDELSITIPATVTYVQGPENKVVVTGPQTAVENLYIDDGRFRFHRRVRGIQGLEITVTASGVREFHMAGSQRLTITGYDQDDLDVHMAGSGDVVGSGRTRRVEVHIAGSGDIDLGAVATDDAEVRIAGSGNSVLSPKDRAEIHIAGSGDVTLTTRPNHLEQHIAGSGRIVQGEERSAPPLLPAVPTAPVLPEPPGA